jgi:hypothetical protein
VSDEEEDYNPGDNSDDDWYEVPKKQPKRSGYPHVDDKYRPESTGTAPASTPKPKPTPRPTPRAPRPNDAGGLHTPPLSGTSTNGQWQFLERSAEFFPPEKVKLHMTKASKAKGRVRMITLLLDKYPHPSANPPLTHDEFKFFQELVPDEGKLEKARRRLLNVSLSQRGTQVHTDHQQVYHPDKNLAASPHRRAVCDELSKMISNWLEKVKAVDAKQ